MRIAYHGPGARNQLLRFAPGFTVSLEAGAITYRNRDGHLLFRIEPDSPDVDLVELVDASPAERLALHWAGFTRLKGLDVDPAVPTKFDAPSEEQAP